MLIQIMYSIFLHVDWTYKYVLYSLLKFECTTEGPLNAGLSIYAGTNSTENFQTHWSKSAELCCDLLKVVKFSIVGILDLNFLQLLRDYLSTCNAFWDPSL